VHKDTVPDHLTSVWSPTLCSTVRYIYRLFVNNKLDFDRRDRVTGLRCWESDIETLIHEYAWLPSYFIIASPDSRGILPYIRTQYIDPPTKEVRYESIGYVNTKEPGHPNKYERLIAVREGFPMAVRLG